MVSDEKIVSELEKRNDNYIKNLLDKYGNLIYKVANDILGGLNDEDAVEECVSDVLFLVWNNIESFDSSKASFKNWICTITKYKAIDYRRKLIKRSEVQNLANLTVACESNVEEAIITKEKRKEIIEMVKGIGEQEYQIFLKRYILDESIVDIANSFKVDRCVIDKKLFKIRNFLKKSLLNEKVGASNGR